MTFYFSENHGICIISDTNSASLEVVDIINKKILTVDPPMHLFPLTVEFMQSTKFTPIICIWQRQLRVMKKEDMGDP